jgi:hypothetical protein
MLRTVLLSSSICILAVVGGCNPYDPNLPDEPFQCGTDEPRCPEGYDPVQVTQVRCVCQLDEGGGGADAGGDGGGGPFTCNDDTKEPNEDITGAAATPIGVGSTSVNFPALAICPASDVDTFRLQVNQTGVGIDVTVTFDASRSQPVLQILSSSGVPVATGTLASAGTVRATHTAGFSGQYYAQVRVGSPAQENNYSINITTTGQ